MLHPMKLLLYESNTKKFADKEILIQKIGKKYGK